MFKMIMFHGKSNKGKPDAWEEKPKRSCVSSGYEQMVQQQVIFFFLFIFSFFQKKKYILLIYQKSILKEKIGTLGRGYLSNPYLSLLSGLMSSCCHITRHCYGD